MPNPTGNPASLVPAPAGNQRALKHGLFAARRELSPEAVAIADELMQLPHVVESDYPTALEIGKLEILLDRIDAALADGVVERRGALRALVDQRRRMSAQLERWYTAFGLTPESRSKFASRLAGASLHAEIARRRRSAR